MSVSARTFQLLYIVRQRALKDLPTTLPDFAAFVAERRAQAPQTYDRAYISPSALQEILDRMCSPVESLLACHNGQFELGFMGSQMADLLDGIDACSVTFIDGYKEQVVQAVLAQRARLGQPPATQREIAACANISLDSARRGLQLLMDTQLVLEGTTGRMQTYALVNPPKALAAPDNILEALAGISDAPCLPSGAVVMTDRGWYRPVQRIKEGDKVLAADGLFHRVGAITQHTRKVPVIPEALVGINEDEDIPPSRVEKDPVPKGTVLQDGGPHAGVQANPACVTHSAGPTTDEVGGAEPTDEPMEKPKSRCYAWGKVPDCVQADLITQAKACDMSLDDYLGYLAQTASMRFRKSIL